MAGGILDFLNSPDAQLGIGLLAAGGPTTDPNQTGLGQRVAGAMNSVRDQQAMALRNKLMQSQVDENATQNMLRQMTLARQMRQDAYYMGGDSPSVQLPSLQGGAAQGQFGAPAGVPSGGAGGAPAGGDQAAGSAPALSGPPPTAGKFDEWSARYGIPKDALVSDYFNNGGKGIAEMLMKAGGRDIQFVNGVAIDKSKTQNGQVLPFVNTSSTGQTTVGSVGPDNQLSVSAPRGAIDTATDYARAQAGLKPIKIYNPDTHREEYTNEAAVATGQAGAPRGSVPNPGLPSNYLNAVVSTESGGNPNAVSPKGAQGLMQVMPGTNTSPGFGVAPAQNGSEGERSRVGADYLKAMNDRYQNPTLAAIAYNWGPGNTDMWLKSGGDFNKLPPETKNYVASVMTRTAVNGMQPAAQGGNFAAGPSAGEKAAIDANAKFQDAGATSANSYRDALNERVSQGSDLNMRLQESVKAMQNFQTGGGKEVRAQAAQVAQAFGAPEKVVNGIAGGDLGSMQEFNKLAVQQAMEQLKSSMGGAGRIAQAEFKVFQANNPNLDTDPTAVKKIFDFNTHLYNRDLAEQQQMGDYIKQGGNPSDWRPVWSQRLQQQGFTNPSLNAQRDASPQAAAQPAQAAGKSFKEFGYSTPADAIKDAQNAMLKNPAAKGEIMKRLTNMGIQMPAAQGSW